jgi:hypothetical protein
MSISTYVPNDCFVGYNPEQGLNFPNFFVCTYCKYGVSFPGHSLADGASNRYLNKPRKSKLKLEIAPFFVETIAEFLSTNLSRFVLDFHCPKCQQPYVIGFDWSEFHMADPRYFPLQVWGLSKNNGV